MSSAALRSVSRRVAAAMLALAVVPGISSAAASNRAVKLLSMGGEAIAILHPTVAETYSSAMADYRLMRSDTAAANHLAGRLATSATRKWHWRAEEGGTVERVGDGIFRLTRNNCLDALCSEVDCYAAAWPAFECTDGRMRTMSAPDLATVVFDGVTYTRSLPPSDDSLLENLPDDGDYSDEPVD